jgi:DNA-binding winged helix-turn-helix (wHTH) protein/tetratricopeptide (TPR) repeat protein
MPNDARAAVGASFQVGRWHVDTSLDTLRLDGTTVKLEPRTMRLLVALAEHAGQVRSTQDLIDEVWRGVVVTDQSLYQAIGELRSVLKADTATPEFVANVPRKGYRLVAPVSAATATEATADFADASGAARGSPRTLAVLPFRDLGLPPELTFLRELLLADLILELSRQPGLSTIARGTMLSYGGRAIAPRQVAQELKVGYVVDGSIAMVGNELAIACELVDAATDTVLASESLRVGAARWTELAPQVIGRVARALRLELSVHATRVVDSAAAEQVSALELAMRAWVELYCRPQGRETNQRAWAWATEALDKDETIGAAWNALAYCEWRAAQYDWHERPWATLLSDAVAHAQRAISFSPSDPDAYYTLGLATYTSGETARAESSLRHCMQISASYAPAYGLLGLVRAVQGFPEETAALCERAFAMSPREPLRAVWHWTDACAASMLGRDRDALDRATAGIAANADYPACYLVAAVSAHRLGHHDVAARCVSVLARSAFSSTQRLRRMLPPMRVEPWATAFLNDLNAAGLPRD